MSTNGIQARTGDIDRNGKATIASSEELDAELTALGNNVSSLMGIWKGEAANSFNDSYVEQNKNFEAFKTLLNDLGEGVVKAALVLDETEEESAGRGKNLFG